MKHKDPTVRANTETEHVCPKPEKVYIHDTVEIRVPSTCKKAHVVAEIKPVSMEGQESNNDSNNSEIKSEN
ncbi:MAG: hypothetical protein LUQ70_03900 [Methanobacteriaceae archaeon]|nr:hypothetical protein [Methanobacteriaceae archaeon]